ncbi:MAG: hypothetical protein HDT40_10055 [Lachnospiraceae bacterium]|nr:hypothetical protein [Lachnospiraceae bacterium]
MAKDFEQIGHKNIELLRFYVSNDINKIDKKIQSNDSQMKGYFLASLVDILIVIIFDKYMVCIAIWEKVLWIIGLIVLFLILSKFVSVFSKWRNDRKKESGRDKYLPDNILQKIDDFDNIACDGLLICENYIQKYKEEHEKYIKNFYLYEIIHYLSKITDIFRTIYAERELYISDENKELLDSYRINNFIEFAVNINSFLHTELGEATGIKSLDNDLKNLNSTISKWNSI